MRNEGLPPPACPLCRHESELVLRTGDRNRHVTDDVFLYYRCRSCALLFLSPIPEDLERYYPDPYYRVPVTLADLRPEAEGQRHKLELVRRYVKDGRLLEIGPAYGAFAYLAKEAGFRVEVVEMDEKCCKFLKREVRVGTTLSDDPLAAMRRLGKFDVIAMWQVIEHLRDPWSLLRGIPAHLNDGGIVVISTPNPDSLQRRVLRSIWTHIDAPRHLQLIPASLAATLAREAGHRVLALETSNEDVMAWNLFGWQHSLQSLVVGRVPRKVMRMVGRLVYYFMRPREIRDLNGSTYTIVLGACEA